MEGVKLCMHVHMSGKQCRRVALKDKSYCHYHHVNYRRNCITDPGYELPILEDCRSLMLGISDVVRTRIKKKIDDKEMTSMMYSMQVATGLMNKVEAMSPDITEEMLENQARRRSGGARAKEVEAEEEARPKRQSLGEILARRLSDQSGIPTEFDREDIPEEQRPTPSEDLFRMLEAVRVKEPGEQEGGEFPEPLESEKQIPQG